MKLSIKNLLLSIMCLLLPLASTACSALKNENNSKESSLADSDLVSVQESAGSEGEALESTLPDSSATEDNEDEHSFEAPEEITVCGDFGYILAEDVAQLCAYYGEALTLDIPEELDGHTVTAITEGAFAGNTTLTQLNVGNSVINVAEDAFKGCTALEKITLGNGVAVVYPGSFDGCPALAEIEVAMANGNFASVDGVLYNDDKSKLIRCPQGLESEEFIIPAGTVLVDDGAFKKCSKITAVVLPAECGLSPNAFFHCDNMQSFSFEGTVTSIPDYCFFGCVLLEELVLPEGVESLGEYAFFGCVGLRKITVPATVAAISDTAFECCTGIEEANVAGECATEWYSNYQK